MKRPAELWGILSALVLVQIGAARAALDEQVLITESAERSCRNHRVSGGVPSGGGFDSTRQLGPDGSLTDAMPQLRPIRTAVNRSDRAAGARRCAEAETLRQALEWEKRPASSTEAVWDAVFVPLWSMATSSSTARRSSSELTQRLEESWRSVLRGHPRSERDELSAMAAEAVTSYRASRAQLTIERICVHAEGIKTEEELRAGLHEVDSLAASLKEQLIDEVWAAVDPAMAAKLRAYAETAQPTVWEASPAFFSDWPSEQIQRTIADLCTISQITIVDAFGTQREVTDRRMRVLQ